MKKIEIITRTEKLEIIKKILVNHNCLGLTVYSVMGCGRQKGHISKAENDDVATNLLPKIYVMTVVKDSELTTSTMRLVQEHTAMARYLYLTSKMP